MKKLRLHNVSIHRKDVRTLGGMDGQMVSFLYCYLYSCCSFSLLQKVFCYSLLRLLRENSNYRYQPFASFLDCYLSTQLLFLALEKDRIRIDNLRIDKSSFTLCCQKVLTLFHVASEPTYFTLGGGSFFPPRPL